ncbi:MFS transporter [Pseudonocardia sp. RS11V-5]|uniref:MFS transporter n=1 Tax=Pseudonocardia terrae TaxID=2905831 RepID=UPI001E53BE5A|nr:MFS transporter [Pseudonocardia terrae]MCE3554743.1 MFS transporter [Pseudonocardia terrae]
MTSAPARRGTEEEYTPDPRRWRALSVTLAAGFMTLLDVSIVSVALPSIQRGLGTDPAGVLWVVSGYALTFGLALVPAGRLGDAFGRRRMFLIALSAFVAFSALCGAAPTIELLVVARLLQGSAAGSLAPQNSGLIQSLFHGAERGRAFGFFGAVVGISTAAGPIVGGLLLAAFGEPDGWRWIFYVNVPIGVLAVVLAARLLPKARTGDRPHIDWAGAGLLGGAVLALLLPLVQAESGGLARLWWLFPIGVALALVPGGIAGIVAAPALLVGGIGGGFVIAPNITMTLRNVPVRMAGSAGGALQTGQRVGAAVGTAVVAGVFYGVLAAAGRSYQAGIAGALGVAVLTTLIALGVAIWDLRDERRHASGVGAPDPDAPDTRGDGAGADDGTPHHISHD